MTIRASVAGLAALLGVTVALAQQGGMMNEGMNGTWMGGYGGYWVPVLAVAVLALIAWIIMQKRR